MNDILEEFEEVKIEDPTDIIIGQIRDLIKSGKLEPGDRLPSEAALQKKFQVKRGVVRAALQKLEFFGILRTIPQSGTIVANLGPQALEGLLSSLLKFEKNDYESLIDTRLVLESHAAALAAERCDASTLTEIEALQKQYIKKVKSGYRGLDLDISFHLKIAEASKSSVLISIITLISPDVLSMFNKLNKTSEERLANTIKEHGIIIQAIKDKDPDAASKAMKEHITTGYRESKH